MQKKRSWKEFIELMSFMKPRLGKYTIGILGLDIAGTGLVIILAFALKYMIDAPIKGQMELLEKAILYIGMAVFIAVTAIPLFYYTYKSSVKKTIAQIREDIFKHIQKYPASYFDNNHSGDVISRISNDAKMVEMFYSDQLQTMSGTAMLGCGAAIFMFVLNWQVSLVLIIISLILVLFNVKFAGRIRSLSDKIQQHMGVFTGNINDFVSGFYIMKIFQIESLIGGKLKNCNEEMTELAVKRVSNSALLDSTNYLVSMINFTGVMCIGAYLVMKNITDFGTVTAMVQLQMILNDSFLSFGKFIAQLQTSLAGANRIFELLQQETEKELSPTADTNEIEDMIYMKSVNFGYGGEEKSLKGLSLKVTKGQVAALVGPSGGGKSTVLKLLMGYYPLEDGLIALEAKPMEMYSLNEIRDMIAYVPQDSYLFDDTIKENIRYGRLDASDEEVVAAARAAFAHDFIMELPEGYNEKAGEKGAKLSIGQKQRISIARALLKDAPILLLDEATSALDSESEHQVKKAIDAFKKGRTVIIVAHRISTIEHADKIFVIDKGVVAEEGTHEELINKNGIYGALCKT